MSRLRKSLIVALGVAALAIPAGALAKSATGEEHGKGHANGQGKAHGVAYVFKGTYAGESTVTVSHGNSRVRKGGFIGQTVSFDLSGARITVADTNSNGERDLGDVQTGDKVLVKASLPRTEPGSQPFVAQRLVDQTRPASS